MLEPLDMSPDCGIYRMPGESAIDRIIATTPETRAIANDPGVMGIDYTRRLELACARILGRLAGCGAIRLEEARTIVFNILRGGLNFGLREALARAFGWNCHGSSFISAQRARKDDSPEQWHIVESDYAKVYMPDGAGIVIGDVVATGTSLEHAMQALVAQAEHQGRELKTVVFFTIGSPRAAQILEATDAMCRKRFPGFERTTLVYLEGCFTVPDTDSRLRIKVTGTDLLRLDAIMAPEFIASQYEDPGYPLQRCAIYDAGSRAFWPREYIQDLTDYWTQVNGLADQGTSFRDLLAERFPELDPERFGPVDLGLLCQEQISRVANVWSS